VRPIYATVAVVCGLAACGEETRSAPEPAKQIPETTPTQPAGDPATKVAPDADFIVEADISAFRKVNALPPDADVTQERKYRAPVSTALVYLSLDSAPVEEAIDERLVTRAIFDGDAVIVATAQPYAEVAKAMVAGGATEDGDVLVHDTYSVGEAGPGLLAVALDPKAIRTVQARAGGRVPAKLQQVLDGAGEGPIRAASLDPKGACVTSVAVSGGEGDQATAVIAVRGKASPDRSRLGRPVGGEGRYAFQDPQADGVRLTVPFTQYDAALAGFLGERVYRC
jgi:hypothetical protein